LTALSKKICLLGDFAVGKTSLVRRFVYNRFEDKYLSTIGVKVSSKTVAVASHGQPTEVTMMIWDLAGSEEFNSVRSSYLRGTSGAILVCDLTRAETLSRLLMYIDELARAKSTVPIIIAANKADLINDAQLSQDDVSRFAASANAPCYLTSAKVGDEVETLFRHLAWLMAPH
jgi:small GTP-binding protein